MSELIDREETVKQICKMGEMVGGHDRDVAISIALFVQDDKTAFPTITIPTAELDTTNDFAEWVECEVSNIFGETMKAYECSKCKRKNIGDVWIMMKLNFCPNCGSDNRKRE